MNARTRLALELLRGLFGSLMVASLTVAALAQEVRLANHYHEPFRGWVRCTIDTAPMLDSGELADGTRFVVAGRRGLDVWAIDLHVHLAARERRTVDLTGAAAVPRPPLWLPANILEHFGGWITVGGTPLEVREVGQDGAAVAAHFAARLGPLLFVHVWLRWYPDQPGLAVGEAWVGASNGSNAEMSAGPLPQALLLRWGDGWVHVAGSSPISQDWGGPLVPAGTSFADGQARAVPVVIGWRRVLDAQPDGAVAWTQLLAAAGRQVSAVGIQRLWPHGNPHYPAGFDAVAWTRAEIGRAFALLHSWAPGTLGPAPNSAVAGAQEDQVFVRGETFLEGGQGAEQVTYATALRTAMRPCHHLEANGEQADPADHPHCVFWSGRPHQNTGVSPDRLGKPRVPSIDECSGWNGPDREHWLCNTLAAAARLFDSPVLQWDLEQQARVFLFGETVKPGWSTSTPDAARSVGWAGIVAVHLWRNLADRGLAERVRARYEDRCRMVYVPALGAKPHDVWDVRTDARLGTPVIPRWMAWQQSIGSYGLWLAATEFDLADVRALAVRAARRCVESNWAQEGTRWRGIVNPPFPPPAVPEPPPPETVHWYETTWDLPACWVVLQTDPAHAKARAIWQQGLADLAGRPMSWVPPGAVPPAPPPPPQVPTAAAVTQRAFTWSFAAPRPVGQFANGDWWVVGPVTITAIAPQRAVGGGRTRNGSMLDPMPIGEPGGVQGWDTHCFAGTPEPIPAYRPELDVAAQLPLTVQVGSIVSVESANGPTESSTSYLRDAAVLTVLESVPPADALRPAYVGPGATVKHRASDIDWTALADLAPAPGMPAAAPLLEKLRHLWFDTCPRWISRAQHPQLGLSDYYRGFTAELGTVGLMVNTTALAEPVRREMVLHLVQIGIDNFAVVKHGGVWGVNGHCNGRKFPVVFAARLLGDAEMLATGTTHATVFKGPGSPQNRRATWSEDGQCFYVEETSPGVFNWGFGGYGPDHKGLAEWGNFHTDNIESDSVVWDLPYRVCCSANGWIGQVLTMRIMGLQPIWKQPAFFDYVDRYVQVMPDGDWQEAWEPWHGRMWRLYRADH